MQHITAASAPLISLMKVASGWKYGAKNPVGTIGSDVAMANIGRLVPLCRHRIVLKYLTIINLTITFGLHYW